MSLRVIGAGFGRTGTKSLQEGLQILGFAPCHHMHEVIMNPDQVPFWDRAARGERMNWDDVFARYQASCDWPSCSFYKELADYYPDAKVILSLRDSRSWYKSVASTIIGSMSKPEAGGRPGLPGTFGPILLGEKTFGNDLSEENMIRAYERHNAEAKRVIPADRLLVFEAKQGWDPLCKFLDVPLPSTPYPSMNSTEEFQARIRARSAS